MPKPIKDNDGTYPSYAWPGGYPIYYVDNDNNVLCPTCASRKHSLSRITMRRRKSRNNQKRWDRSARAFKRYDIREVTEPCSK